MRRYTVLVMRALVHLLGTIRWRPEISMASAFNHAFYTDLAAVLCLFQIVVPIAGSRLLVRHFQRINTGVVVRLGCKDGSTTAIGKNRTLCFFLVLCLLAFPIFLQLHRLLRMGTWHFRRSDIWFWISTTRCCQRCAGAHRGTKGYKHWCRYTLLWFSHSTVGLNLLT